MNNPSPVIELKYPSFTAKISRKGGQLLSCKFTRHEELFYLSTLSSLIDEKAIRGGIPICWPWFAADKEGPFHGFARNTEWTFEEPKSIPGATKITGRLQSELSAEQPLSVKIEYLFHSYEPTVTIRLTTKNTSDELFGFTQALHTYIHVGNIASVSVHGLEGSMYYDQLTGTFVDEHERVVFDREVDRIYYSEGDVTLVDPIKRRCIRVSRNNSGSMVVWNPWIEKEKRMPDMVEGDYQNMVCLEAANVGKDKIILIPSGTYTLETSITILPML